VPVWLGLHLWLLRSYVPLVEIKLTNFESESLLLLKPDPIVLVIDNQKASRRLLRALLEPQGYRVLEADSGGAGLNTAADGKPDVIILEIALPQDEGLSVLQSLREWSNIPVLVLSERTDDEAKVAALDAGASDYITKPFSSAELLARLRVLQRPLPNVPDGPLLILEDLVINLATHEITLHGRALSLTPKESALFYVLARYAGKVVTRSHLLRSVWGNQSGEKIHDLLVLVANLRKKLRPYAGELLIRTEGSLGYILALSPRHSSGEALSRTDANADVMRLAAHESP
jgi:two-component system KDP operon response regulator KdpE